jgi:hypothetical protein
MKGRLNGSAGRARSLDNFAITKRRRDGELIARSAVGVCVVGRNNGGCVKNFDSEFE